MRLLFVHNIRLYKDNRGQIYTHSSYNEKVWKRYLSISNKFTIISRKTNAIYSETEAKQQFERFDTNRISYIETENIHRSLVSYINPSARIKNNKIIKEAVQKHDYIIVRLPSYYGYQAIEYAKLYEKPYLIEVVACPWDTLTHHGIKGKLLAPKAYLKLKKVAKKAPYVVYVTNHFLQNRYPTKGFNIGCSDVLLKDLNKEVLSRRISKISNENNKRKIVIGTTAAVDVRYKGQQYIIEALGQLKAKGLTNFEYQLVGAGDQTYLKNLAKKYKVYDQIKFLGQLTHDKVFEWLETIDIYAQPSKTEGLPRALIEAMSLGIPAIGSNAGGIPELLEDEYIFSKTRNSINEICDILLSFNNQNLTEQAKRNFNHAKRYHRDIIENRRNEFYRKFIKSIDNI